MSDLEDYLEYLDQDRGLRDIWESGLEGRGALGILDLIKKGYGEEGLSGALSPFTKLAGVPKRALVDIPVNAVSEAMVGPQREIRPAQDIATDALIPPEELGESEALSPH